MQNPFTEVRYKDSLTLEENISMSQLAKKMGVSKSLISRLEKEGCDNCRVSTIKLYKEHFPEVTYDYLLGAERTKDVKYHSLGELFPFDDSFYKHLEQLLAMDEDNNHFVEYMLSALIYHPQEMFNTLNIIFNALYKIHTIQNDKSLSASDKSAMIKMQEYIFNQSTIEYLEGTVMPLLKKGFELKNKQQAEEAVRTQEMLNEINDNIDTSTPVSVKVNSVIEIEKVENA